MLKRSKRVITYEMTERIKRIIKVILNVIDRTFDMNYYEVYYQVYINSEKMKLEQVAQKCYISRHKLINDIKIINRLIGNTYLYLEKEEGIKKNKVPKLGTFLDIEIRYSKDIDKN